MDTKPKRKRKKIDPYDLSSVHKLLEKSSLRSAEKRRKNTRNKNSFRTAYDLTKRPWD